MFQLPCYTIQSHREIYSNKFHGKVSPRNSAFPFGPCYLSRLRRASGPTARPWPHVTAPGSPAGPSRPQHRSPHSWDGNLWMAQTRLKKTRHTKNKQCSARWYSFNLCMCKRAFRTGANSAKQYKCILQIQSVFLNVKTHVAKPWPQAIYCCCYALAIFACNLSGSFWDFSVG